MTWCLTGTRPLSISYDDLIYNPWNVWHWNGSICNLYECHMQAYITGWHNAWLQCLQCVSNGVAAALHWAIDIDLVHGQWPGAWLAPGRCLYRMMTLYIPHEINYMCGIEMTVYATYMYMSVILQGLITGWFDAGLRCLQCVSNGSCCGLASSHRYSAWAVTWCLTGTRLLSISMMTSYIPHEINYMCGIEMAVNVTYMSVICRVIYLDGLMRDCGFSSPAH